LYDDAVKHSLSGLLNVDISLQAWTQASLPLRWGGLGIRSASQLAPSAFLASAAGVADLLTLLLPPELLSLPYEERSNALLAWQTGGGSQEPVTGGMLGMWKVDVGMLDGGML